MQRGSNSPGKKKPGRVSLPPIVAPSRSSPFAGISGTKAPAKNEKIPNLTQHVAVAKARVEALKNAGLVTEAKREAAVQAQTIIDQSKPAPKRTPQTLSKPSAAKAPGLPASLTKPAVALDQPPARRAPATPPGSLNRRGAPPKFVKGQAAKTGGIDFGFVRDAGNAVLSDPLGYASLLTPGGKTGAIHSIKTGNVTQDVSKGGVQLASHAAGLGTQAVGKVPTHFDVVAPAGAASFKPVTKDELKVLEAKGYDLAPAKRARFLKLAAKNGWNPAELDGISGSALIDKAFTKPGALPLRVIGNAAAGVARLGTIPAGVEGIVRETAAGNGLQVAQALGEGLISELPGIGKHKVTDTAVADPYGFITQFAGAGKLTGAVAGAVGKRAGRTAAERVVDGVSRGPMSRNAYDATGQMISDAAARRIPRVGAKVKAKQIDDIVALQTNKHQGVWRDTQRAYKKALDKVGDKRAAELSGYQMAGGKPEQFAAFYRAQGNTGQAKFWDRVTANTKTLDARDTAFLEAHAPVSAQTTQGAIDIQKFGPTAAEFRRYSPLIRSSARLGDPDAQSLLKLREEYIKGFNTMPEEDLAALRGAIDQGVNDFAAQHIKSGGVEPTYVEYSKPLPLTPSPFKPGTGGPTGFKKPRGRQKAETGATFESGDYLIDPKAPLIASIRMQRAHLADSLHEVVAKEVARPLKAGDALKDGEVFVSETNLRGLRRTVNDLADNPVSAPDYEALVSSQQSIFDRLKGAAVTSTEHVPRGEKGYALPIASWKRILDHTRAPSRNSYDKLMGQYQRVLIGYRPSTFVNNAVGSPMLSATFGAGPKSAKMAWQSGPNRDYALAPSYLSGGGVAGGLAPNPRSKVGTGLDWSRYQSQKAEDLNRRAAYFSAALPGSDKRAAELGYPDRNSYLRDVAAGKVDEDRLQKGLDRAAEALGDSLKPNGKFGRAAGRTILFHNWVGHMAKMLLYTLPVKHPLRLSVLNELADYGDQYRQEHGVWPDWYASYIPLFNLVKRVGPGKAVQQFTKSYNTQGWNSFATLNNFAQPVSTNESAGNILLGLSNPLIATAGKTLFARPYDSTNPYKFAAGQIVRQVPGVSIVRPQGGMAADSIPFIAEKRKVYSSGRKVNGKSIPLPWDLRPGARAEPGVLGALERWAFGGVYDVPAQGPIHSIDQKKHIGAMAKAARKNR